MSESSDFKKANFYKNNFYRWAHLIKELKALGNKTNESEDTLSGDKKADLGPPSYNDIYGKLCIKTPPRHFPPLSAHIYQATDNSEKVIQVNPSTLASTATKSTTKPTGSNTLSQVTLPEAHYPQRQPIGMSTSNATGLNTQMSFGGTLAGPSALGVNQPPPPPYPDVGMPPPDPMGGCDCCPMCCCDCLLPYKEPLIPKLKKNGSSKTQAGPDKKKDKKKPKK